MKKLLKTKRIVLSYTKLIATILILTALTVSTATAQKSNVVMSANKLTVRKAIAEIESQTKLNFGFSEDFNLNRTVEFVPLSMTLDAALNVIAGKEFNCRHDDKYVIILKKTEEKSEPFKEISDEEFRKAVANFMIEPKKEAPQENAKVMSIELNEYKQEQNFEPRQSIPANLYNGFRMRSALKTNLLYLATTTPNIGLEFSVSDKVTLELSGGYNAFKFNSTETSNPKLMHWAVMPEARYWFCRSFEGAFVGIHGLYSQFNVENVPLINKPLYRAKGYAAGGGVNFGYHWALGKNWGFELSAGAGAIYLDYDTFDCGACGKLRDHKNKVYYGPTKLSVSFLYFLR